jgi:hypothetical protein
VCFFVHDFRVAVLEAISEVATLNRTVNFTGCVVPVGQNRERRKSELRRQRFLSPFQGRVNKTLGPAHADGKAVLLKSAGVIPSDNLIVVAI